MRSAADLLDILVADWAGAGAPKRLQAAADGRWEQARMCDAPVAPALARALVADSAAPDADVAVEFEWVGTQLAFVGARRGPGDATAFADDVARLAAADPADPERALALLAGGPPRAPEHLELGAANAWRSVGPLRLWSAGAGREPAPLAERLREHPRLACCSAPVALVLSFGAPRECWVGLELSARVGAEHIVEAARVEALVGRLVG